MPSLGAILSKKLHEHRKRHGLTQGSFATLIGFSRATINRWETTEDAGRATIEEVDQISKKLKIPAFELLSLESSKPPEQVQLPKAQWEELQKHLRPVPAGRLNDLSQRLSRLPEDRQEILWMTIESLLVTIEQQQEQKKKESG